MAAVVVGFRMCRSRHRILDNQGMAGPHTFLEVSRTRMAAKAKSSIRVHFKMGLPAEREAGQRDQRETARRWSVSGCERLRSDGAARALMRTAQAHVCRSGGVRGISQFEAFRSPREFRRLGCTLNTWCTCVAIYCNAQASFLCHRRQKSTPAGRVGSLGCGTRWHG